MQNAAAPVPTAPVDVVLALFDALNRRDLDRAKQFWTADTVERFPDKTCHGTDEICAYFRQTFAALPDWHLEMIASAATGEHVFVQWKATGTHEGELLGIAATGKKLALDGTDHFVVRDGKVVSNFVVFDQMQFARQIGMLPPDGALADRALKTIFSAKTKVARALGG